MKPPTRDFEWTRTRCWWCSGHCNITISRGPGFDPLTRQEKEVPMNMLVCSCGSFVEYLLGVRIPVRGITSPWRAILGWAKATCTCFNVAWNNALIYMPEFANYFSFRFRKQKCQLSRFCLDNKMQQADIIQLQISHVILTCVCFVASGRVSAWQSVCSSLGRRAL